MNQVQLSFLHQLHQCQAVPSSLQVLQQSKETCHQDLKPRCRLWIQLVESNVEKLLELEFSPAKSDDGELERKVFLRGGTNGVSRVAGIHSKRNHTIGLGELDQLNLIVTESVICWASCTHIPTVPSLRLSLVC